MPEVNSIERRMAAQELWSASHDGRIDQLWEQQAAFNKDFRMRVRALERFQAIVLGGALALGFLGSFLGSYFRAYLNG